jgi:hypothetical protein
VFSFRLFLEFFFNSLSYISWISSSVAELEPHGAFSMHIYYNFPYTESEEIRMSDLMITYIPIKNVDLLYSRVGAGAASKFSPGAA